MDKTGVCYIVGGGDFDAARFLPQKEDFIIAADCGLVYIEETGYQPDLIVGDFDSLGYRPPKDNVVLHPTEKNDTDMALAADIAMQNGYKKMYLFGISGGRLDHTLANMQLLTDLCLKGVEVYCFCPDCTITALTQATLCFSPDYYGTVSVFSAGDKAQAVTLTGFKYSLTDEVLQGRGTLGVSNEFIGKEATVCVGNGVLWILWLESKNCALPVLLSKSTKTDEQTERSVNEV